MHRFTVVLALLLSASPLGAAPNVATDIPPVQSLVARVMEGVGVPSLVMTPGASPHGYAMRPSEAATLQNADMVIWVGPELTPWLERSIGSLAADTATLELLDADGTRHLEFRESARFEAHDHAGDETHEEHNHDHGHDHDSEHGAIDPHAWLDPANGQVWLEHIAAALSEIDPDNATIYAANAQAGKAELETLSTEISASLEPVQGQPFIVFHDAYHYFEARFGIEAAGAVTLGDATSPGPARLQEIRATIAETGAVCVFAEPQFEPAILSTVLEGRSARSGVLDPLGAGLEQGPALYPTLLTGLATALVDCLGHGA